MKTSAIEACTREAQNAMFRIRDGQYLAFDDVPGIGESAQCDEKYLSMYQDLVRKSDVVVHMLRADCRDYAIDEAAFARLFPDRASRRKVILDRVPEGARRLLYLGAKGLMSLPATAPAELSGDRPTTAGQAPAAPSQGISEP